MPDALSKVFQYHESTKHRFSGYARGPGHLDWANQPNPFRRYEGATLLPLKKIEPTSEPLYDDAFAPGRIAASPVDIDSVSQLFFDSLALSAWKSIGTSKWALRVNPSSGNLHPTEGYLICGAVDGLCNKPMVAHYAPHEHGLEVRTEFESALWNNLTEGLPANTVLLALTSIHWREAWKYGERSFRYCQHDVGHAIGAIAMAASGLGWQAKLLDGLSSDQVSLLTGTFVERDAEVEEPDCLIAIIPNGDELEFTGLGDDVFKPFRSLDWRGQPNHLSPTHRDWNLKPVAEATHKPTAREPHHRRLATHGAGSGTSSRTASLRQIIRQRRSAVSMDGKTSIDKDEFFLMLRRTLDVPGHAPFDALPWKPHVHLAIFVHRVEGLPSGLYFLVRDPSRLDTLQESVTQADEWRRPEGCPDDLDLYLLIETDARNASKQISCHQDIASDGCFSLGMIAEFEGPVERYGAWFYPRLFWECGLIGQVLYLEAEAAGIRSTGIGCYFDDAMHDVLGLKDRRFQDLYHFTVGGPVDDHRLTTLPAYSK